MRTIVVQETAFKITEKLLQRGSREVQSMSFWWRGTTCNQALFFFFFWQKLSASHEEQLLPWRIKCFSRYEEIQELGLGFPGIPVVNSNLAMQGASVQSMVWEDPTCHRATKPVRHNYWSSCTLKLTLHNEKPLHCNWKVAPTRHNSRKPARSHKDQCSQTEQIRFL